jgi:undecaprenyl-diphosphatase
MTIASCLTRHAVFIAATSLCAAALAADGPLGIDHRLPYDNSGIWRRHNQVLLQDLTAVVVIGGALWQGDEDRLGRTFWQSTDATVLGTLTANLMKPVFSRARPSQTDDPNQWFKGRGHNSFPSGEVALVSGAVTPFVLEYGKDHPAIYALEALPLYDAVARMKVQGHWQTDVLAGFLIGTGMGYYAHQRESPLTIQLIPGGWRVGLRAKF